MIDVAQIIQHKDYRTALSNILKSVHGAENKEDAESCAIVAMLEEEPDGMAECIACMKRAIERFRNNARKIERHEMSYYEAGLL